MPYAAGGSTDVIAPAIADKLRLSLGVPIIVENKPGGGGAVGSASVARAEPNGYTLLLTLSGAVAIAPLAMKPSPFVALKDFTPVAALHKYQLFLYARSAGGYKSMEELIAPHKAGKSISMAITGVGNSTHYCAFWLGKELGIDFVNVPYSSGSQMAMSTVKGEVDVGFLPAADLQSQINSGADAAGRLEVSVGGVSRRAHRVEVWPEGARDRRLDRAVRPARPARRDRGQAERRVVGGLQERCGRRVSRLLREDVGHAHRAGADPGDGCREVSPFHRIGRVPARSEMTFARCWPSLGPWARSELCVAR